MDKLKKTFNSKFKRITASVLALCLTGVMLPTFTASAASGTTYECLTVSSGFNADVVATSTSSSSSEHYSNTDTLDNAGKASRGACFYNKNVFSSSGYLPDSKTITSTNSSTPGLTWQMADYTSNNALKLYPGNSTGKLSFSKYGCYQKVYMLCVAGGLGAGNSANMDTTITYTDGTTSTSKFSVYDWYDNKSVATAVYQRISNGSQDGSTSGGPYMTQCAMSVDTTKLIKDISFVSSTSGMYLGVLAVTGVTANINAPVATAGTSIGANAFTANWNEVSDASGYVIDVSKNSDFSSILTGYNNLNVGNNTSYAVSGLDKNTTYYYRVRAYSSEGYSASSNVISAQTTNEEKCVVTFKADGVTVDSKSVDKGTALTDIPAVPAKTGYNGVWDVTDFSNITSDMTVNAVYTAETYTIKFVADGKVIAEKPYEYGTTFTDIPKIPAKEGCDKTAPYWDNDFTNISKDTTVNAVYTINTYAVTFMVDGKAYQTKTVNYGDTLTDVPTVPAKAGYDQTKPYWDTTDFTNIKADKTVNAVYTINEYTITLPTGEGFTVQTKDALTLNYGDNFRFTVAVKDGYTAGEDFAVKADGVTVTPDKDGVYTVYNVIKTPVITVTGISDITKPEAAVKVSDKVWNTLLNAITFNVYFNDTQNVEITAADAGSGIAKIEYILSETPLTEEALVNSTEWKEYTEQFAINPNCVCVVYAKVTDNAGNVTYVSSDGMTFTNEKPQPTTSAAASATTANNTTTTGNGSVQTGSVDMFIYISFALVLSATFVIVVFTRKKRL